MKKAVYILLFAFWLVLFCSCAEKDPADTMTYAHIDDETEETWSAPAETVQSESAETTETTAVESTATEPTESESVQTETEKQADTETEAVTDPGDVHFSGFTPIAENASPVDMNGLNLSAFDENSVEYAVYGDVGRLAVISAELKLYNKEANSRIEKKKLAAPSCPFKVYVYEKSYERGLDLRGKILGLLAAFNVSEYEGKDDIEEKYNTEYINSLNEFRKLCGSGMDCMNGMHYLTNDRSWQQDMMNAESKKITEICSDLIRLKERGVSYGNEVDDLIEDIASLSEELSSFWTEAYETMMGTDFPYPYRIERAYYGDHMMLYIYNDDNIRFTRPDTSSLPANDICVCKYNKEEKRYEIYWNYYINSAIRFAIQNKTTGLTRSYCMDNLGFLKGIVDIGEYNEKEVLDILPAEFVSALKKHFGENMDLVLLQYIGQITLKLSPSGSGIGSISAETLASYDYFQNKPIPAATLKSSFTGDGYTHPELKTAIEALIKMSSRVVYWKESTTARRQKVKLYIDYGVIPLDAGSLADLAGYAEINLFNCRKLLEEANGEALRRIVTISGNHFLRYVGGDSPYYTLWYLDNEGKHKTEKLMFDMEYKFVKQID